MSTQRDHVSDTVDARMRPDTVMPATLAPDSAAAQRGGAPGTAPVNRERSAVVVVPVPSRTVTPYTPTATGSSAPAQHGIHVAPNLRDPVIAAPLATPQEIQIAQEPRDLNAVVHGVLIIGLIISTALMLVDVGLALFSQRDLPTAVPEIGDVINRVRALRPSGFLALGLLVLIATPILRVIGSIGAFVYERDWRFAGVTTLVLGVLIVSLVLGRG
jgi:uncharacterized membrane protein